MPDHVETEVKLSVPDLGAVSQRLQSECAVMVSPRTLERNVRYENEARSLSASGIVVRLRQDSRNRLTYKGPALNTGSGITSRFEAEVEVGDFETMSEILKKLGYHPYMIYEKYRTTYALDDTEIVLDELPYGNFVEIEGETEPIEQAIARLDLAGAIRYRASYTLLFDYVRHHLKLDFTDLTFANFAGMIIPESAFQSPEPF